MGAICLPYGIPAAFNDLFQSPQGVYAEIRQSSHLHLEDLRHAKSIGHCIVPVGLFEAVAAHDGVERKIGALPAQLVPEPFFNKGYVQALFFQPGSDSLEMPSQEFMVVLGRMPNDDSVQGI